MVDLFLVLQLAIDVAFALLAIRTIVAWLRQPDRRYGSLAVALSSLALVILLAPALGGSGPWSQVVTDGLLVLFLVSGYGLYTFRETFVPSRLLIIRAVTVAIVAVGLLDVVVQLPANPDGPHSPLQSLALALTIGIWVLCILEPIVTFWLASRGRPAVERARLRALSMGYAGLLLVIVVGTIVGTLSAGMTAAVDVPTLAMVPLLYVAFFPPGWLRRTWRQPEEDKFRLALHDLLLYSPDRGTLADRALLWAERLVGGAAGYVVDFDGTVLATRGISADDALALSQRARISAGDSVKVDEHSPWRAGSTLVVPLDLSEGSGAMVLITDRLSPMFGDDELGRLRQYAASISAGLDRVAMNLRIKALEQAKTDFLNIASHELRGPMTVIKGYLTMLEAGALGELAPKARSVLPLLISKSDEVNWMVEQMIEVARLEEGRLTLKRQRTDISELTDAAVDGVKTLLTEHEVKIDAPAHPIDAEVDPDRFQIVVRNLLSNAAKYSAAGTEIDVKVKRNGDKAMVTVTDQGVGISREDQKNLFVRFGRIENHNAVQGTGLGLWLSREIARMHNGDLTVESQEGVGTTFTFSVPLSN